MIGQRRVVAGGLLCALIAIGLAALAVAGKSEKPTRAALVTLPHGGPGTFSMVAPSATPSAALGLSGLSHAKPPDPDQLRDYGQAQAVYDAEAKPGGFVTPPSVSVAH